MASSEHERALSVGAPQDPLLHRLLPWFARATQVDVLASFAMLSGVTLLMSRFESALLRGARVRVLTSDYLHITQPRALRALLDLQELASACPGSFELRVVLTQDLAARQISSFHPKAWLLQAEADAIAFVGSSNLSRAALLDGVEWNLSVTRSRDAETYQSISSAYEALWAQASAPALGWLDAYTTAYLDRQAAASVDVSQALATLPPSPRPAQRAALVALAEHRAQGHHRALIVLATGLGKTWLAAFDTAHFGRERGLEAPRILFVAHRVQLLQQAQRTFRQLYPDASFTWCAGSRVELGGQIVLASVQKLSRLLGTRRLSFDYVVVDEVHHAHAASYRRVLDGVDAGFWLGLTATPERADGVHVAQLFEGHVVYRAQLPEGIAQGALVPFHYVGLQDTVDYEALPWRAGGIDLDALEAQVQTHERMVRVADALAEHAELEAHRTLVFCCTIQHAKFVARWFAQERGWRVAVVYAGAGSDDLASSISRLECGELDAICAVDMLNEGVDIPSVDRVVFLRPTESPVVFLQQLGRGLRAAPQKQRLIVMDLVGNHRMFWDRWRALMALSADRGVELVQAEAALRAGLPFTFESGCSFALSLEVIALLAQLEPSEEDAPSVSAYRALSWGLSGRPTAADLALRAHSLKAFSAYGGWLSFLAAEAQLSEAQLEAWRAASRWLTELERSSSYNAAFLEATWSKLGLPSQVAAQVLTLAQELLAYHEVRAQRKDTQRLMLRCVGAISYEDDALWWRCDEPALAARSTWYARSVQEHVGLKLSAAEGGRWRVEPISAGVDAATLWARWGGEGVEVEGRLWMSAGELWWERTAVPLWEEDAALKGRSRTLPDWAAQRARQICQALWARLGQQELALEGRRFRLENISSSGALSVISLDAQGMARGGARAVTTTDLGWVVVAAQEAAEAQMMYLDEALVNVYRYAACTPHGSTRYIDTGWALRLFALWQREGEPAQGAS